MSVTPSARFSGRSQDIATSVYPSAWRLPPARSQPYRRCRRRFPRRKVYPLGRDLPAISKSARVLRSVTSPLQERQPHIFSRGPRSLPDELSGGSVRRCGGITQADTKTIKQSQHQCEELSFMIRFLSPFYLNKPKRLIYEMDQIRLRKRRPLTFLLPKGPKAVEGHIGNRVLHHAHQDAVRKCHEVAPQRSACCIVPVPHRSVQNSGWNIVGIIRLGNL